MKRISLALLTAAGLALSIRAQPPATRTDLPPRTPVPFQTLEEGQPVTCCPPGTKKVCVAEPAVKKVPRVVYTCKCEEYCLPRCCNLFGHWFGGDQGCGCANCTRVRYRNVLYKKIILEDCPTMKCTPVCVPCKACPCQPCQAGPCKPDEAPAPAWPEEKKAAVIPRMLPPAR